MSVNARNATLRCDSPATISCQYRSTTTVWGTTTSQPGSALISSSVATTCRRHDPVLEVRDRDPALHRAPEQNPDLLGVEHSEGRVSLEKLCGGSCLADAERPIDPDDHNRSLEGTGARRRDVA